MIEYQKIQSVFKRDKKTHEFIESEFSLPEFEYLKDNLWNCTEKIDGTNIRVNWNADDNALRFGGKTNNAQMPISLYRKLNKMFTRDKFMDLYPETSMCLYGEGYGRGIQGGGKYIPNDVDFILFDVLIDRWWLKRKSIKDIASKLGIDVVPFLGKMSLEQAIILIKSKTLRSKWGNFLPEGIVLKPTVELKTRSGDRVITKLKHKDF